MTDLENVRITVQDLSPAKVVVTDEFGKQTIVKEVEEQTVTIGMMGPQGARGPQGLVWRGEWDNATIYEEFDAVFCDGIAYISLSDNNVGQPPNTEGSTWWNMLIDTSYIAGMRDDTQALYDQTVILESQSETSADNAALSASAAADSESNAATSASNALASENKAHKWAEEAEDVEVETGEYSAYHWAKKAEALGDPVEDQIVDGQTEKAPSQNAVYDALATKIENVVEDTTPELGGELDSGEHTIGFTERSNTSSAGAVTIDWTKSNHQSITLTEDTTFTFTAPTNPCNLTLRVVQDATGGWSATFPSIKTSGGLGFTISTDSDSMDILMLYYDGADYYGSLLVDMR